MRKFLIITAGASSLLVVLGVGVWVGAVYHDRLEMAMRSPARDKSPEFRATTGNAPQAKATADEPKPIGKTLYHCGMHPWIIQEHPGNCPICHMELTPIHGATTQTAPAMANQESDGAAITIDPAVVQNMGVQTAEVKRGTLTKSLRTIGTLEVPETGLCDITIKVNGYIEKLYADSTGMHIHKGDPLFDLYSPDLLVAEEELIAARKSADALSPASEEMRKQAQRLVEGARRKLELLDVPDSEIDEIAKGDHAKRVMTFHSPVNGHLEDKMVVQGSAVQAGMKLMRIENHAALWLEAQVYEEQLPLVRLGDTADATLDAFPGQTFSGKIIFISPHLDHMNRTVAVRIALENPDFALKPGMYATVQIHARPIDGALMVPRETVIDTGTRKIVFMQQSEGHFSPRRVTTGISGDNNQLQILSGLAAGEVVVTSGQFLMDVESRTQEAIQKLQTPETSARVTTTGRTPATGGAMSDTNSPATQSAATTIAGAMKPPASTGRTDPVTTAYLHLAARLQNAEAEEKSLDVTELLAASKALAEESPSFEQPLAVTLAEAVAEMKDQPLAKQRKSFGDVGAAIVPLVDADPPSTAIADKLYIVNCPMENANWLQTHTGVDNPFLPEMRSCGSISRTIALSPKK